MALSRPAQYLDVLGGAASGDTYAHVRELTRSSCSVSRRVCDSVVFVIYIDPSVPCLFRWCTLRHPVPGQFIFYPG